MKELSYKTEGRTEMLKARTKRCVCKYCGSRLKLKQLNFSEHDDARIEIFCKNCDRIEFGVEQEIYESAKYFVEQMAFNYYPDLDDTEQTKRMNIAKVCEIMAWQDKMLGFLNKEGFAVSLQKTPFIGECLHLTDEELDDIEVVEADSTVE
ncbi:MAG: hypothetical protein UDG94_01030 [Peptococcaceae bacterium]|nr:hypothetical protein [Peptococcaceae bacterium]